MNEHTVRTEGSVVVPAVSAPSSVAICRSLGKRGIDVIVAAENETAATTRSRYCSETRIVPAPGTDFGGYVEALLALARRPDVRTIVPVREEDVYALARYRDVFSAHVGIPWPDAATLRRVQDRLELFETAERAGVSVPETGSADEWTGWDRRTILKARYSLLANEYVPSHSPETIEAVPKTIFLDPGEKPDHEAITARMGHVPIAQEYVDNANEYGFFALYDHGEAVATFQHRQLRGYHYCGGPSAFRESVSIPELDRAGRRLLDALEWHGLAMVEFLRDENTGEFRLMEINPRFWSSLPFSVQAGADFPYYYWQLATGARDEIDPAYEPGLAGHLLRGEAIYLHSVLTHDYPLVERPGFGRAVWNVVHSVIRHPRFDYLVADDPLPFVRDLRNAAASVLGRDEAEPERDLGEPPLAPGTDTEPERVEAPPLQPMTDGGDDGDDDHERAN